MVIEVGPDEPIGDLIRRARRARFQSQQQLAQQLNKLSGRDTVTGREVARWESHERIPRPYSRRWIAEALGIDQRGLDGAAAVAAAMRRSAATQPAAGASLPTDDACSVGAAAGGPVPTAASKTPEEVLVSMLSSTAGLEPGSGEITIRVTTHLSSQLRGWSQLISLFGSWELLQGHAEPVDFGPSVSTWLRLQVMIPGPAC